MSSSSKMTLSASALPFLPQEILVQILSKLPAKSLVRFKCVSKFVLSLMVDHHPFADLHRNWSLTLPSRMSILIFYQPSSDPNTYRYYTINNYSEVKPQANRLRYLDDDADLFGNFYLLSAVNGLLCLCRSKGFGDDIAIHNLSTRRHISLPTTCPNLRRDSRTLMNACGLLGFDPVSRRYKVLKSEQFTDHINGHVSVKHWVFTLGVDKSWREIHSSPSFHPYNCFNTHFYFATSVDIDGIIYSLNSLNYTDHYIVAFDFRTENFQAIPPPPRPSLMMSGLLEVDGRLAVLWPLMDIWTLEKESMVWKKQYSIDIPSPIFEELANEELNMVNLFCPVNHHVGEIAMLVMLKGTVSILFYNLRRQSLRKFDICELYGPLCEAKPRNTAMHFILDNVF